MHSSERLGLLRIHLSEKSVPSLQSVSNLNRSLCSKSSQLQRSPKPKRVIELRPDAYVTDRSDLCRLCPIHFKAALAKLAFSARKAIEDNRSTLHQMPLPIVSNC
jgi:hypothetical protein